MTGGSLTSESNTRLNGYMDSRSTYINQTAFSQYLSSNGYTRAQGVTNIVNAVTAGVSEALYFRIGPKELILFRVCRKTARPLPVPTPPTPLPSAVTAVHSPVQPTTKSVATPASALIPPAPPVVPRRSVRWRGKSARRVSRRVRRG